MRSRFTDLANHYNSLVQDCRYHGTSYPRVCAGVELWCRLMWWPLLCWLFSHQYVSCASAENGTEEIFCERCGDYHYFRY